MSAPSGLAALVAIALSFAAGPVGAQASSNAVEVDAPRAVLGGIPFTITLTAGDELDGAPYQVRDATGTQLAAGTLVAGENAIEGLEVRERSALPLTVTAGGASEQIQPRLLPAWLSLFPPLFSIVLALLLREVVISLFAGIWLGALFLAGLNPFAATLDTLDEFVLGAVANDPDRVSIAMFSLLLGGMVGIIVRSGGMRGIVEVLTPYATNARRGQLMTWFAGLLIFFDDYANTLIVGNTMRPVTDKLRVSREKLAYIVDSTSAPIAATALISTWVGFEISLIAAALESAGAQATDPAVRAALAEGAANPFNVFLHSIPYRFYPLLALAFGLMVALTGRDLGPMARAERRAATGGGVLRPGAVPLADPASQIPEMAEEGRNRWYNAIVPVLLVITVALAGIVFTGLDSLGPGDHAVWDVVGAGNSFSALLWASFTGCVVAMAMAVSQRVLTLGQAIDAWMSGMRAMLLAIVILVLAWGLGGVTEALGAGTYLAQLLQGTLPLNLLPVLVFLVAAGISFATGTSWGTMAILFPIVVPLAVAMGAGVNFAGGEEYTILLGVISSILAGSIFGDHCSPISDTTVMSSMASSCDHIDHVRTQLPYAFLVAVVGMTVGDIPTAFGLNPFVSLVLGALILYGVLRFFGRAAEVEQVQEAQREVLETAGSG